jgi:hypothetical protein
LTSKEVILKFACLEALHSTWDAEAFLLAFWLIHCLVGGKKQFFLFGLSSFSQQGEMMS